MRLVERIRQAKARVRSAKILHELKGGEVYRLALASREAEVKELEAHLMLKRY